MRRVLIVEDDREVAAALADMVQLLDGDAMVVHDSRQALAVAQTEFPDLVLLDINIPGIDGFEVCRYIKREPLLAQTPIIVVSVEDDLDYIRKAREVGAEDYLVKPVSLDVLEEAISRALSY